MMSTTLMTRTCRRSSDQSIDCLVRSRWITDRDVYTRSRVRFCIVIVFKSGLIASGQEMRLPC